MKILFKLLLVLVALLPWQAKAVEYYGPPAYEAIITSPKGGDIWEAGKTYQIVWNIDPIRSAKTVDLTLQDPACLNSPCIAIAPFEIIRGALNHGIYVWTVPNNMSSRYTGQQMIRLTTDTGITTLSSTITIKAGNTTPPPPTQSIINVQTPRAGEIWYTGETKNINWTGPQTLLPVGVQVYLEPYIACLHTNPQCKIAQPPLLSLGNGYLSSGQIAWTIPHTLSDTYIRENTIIVQTNDGQIGRSGVFTISRKTTQDRLTIISGNDGSSTLKGTVGKFFFSDFATTGGASPVKWRISQGSLPPGLSLGEAEPFNFRAVCPVPEATTNSYNIPNPTCPSQWQSGRAEIFGTPTQTGSFNFTLEAKDNLGQIATLQINITIQSANINVSQFFPANLIRTPNGAVHLILDGNRYYTFSSWQEFISLGYRPYHIKTFSKDPNAVNGLTRSLSFERPSGTIFKYQNSPAIFYLTRERCKQTYSSWSVFRLWRQTMRDVVVMPQGEEFPTCAEDNVRLPEGSAVSFQGPTIFIYQGGFLRPVASWQGFTRLGYKPSDVVNLDISELKNYKQGLIIE